MWLRALVYGGLAGAALLSLARLFGFIAATPPLAMFAVAFGLASICQIVSYGVIRRRLPRMQLLLHEGLLTWQSSFALTKLNETLERRDSSSLKIESTHKHYSVIAKYVRAFLQDVYGDDRDHRNFRAKWKLLPEESATCTELEARLTRKAEACAALIIKDLYGWENLSGRT